MNETTAIVDRSLSAPFGPAVRGSGHASTADFGAALADAQAASRRVADRPGAAGSSTHLVRAGETLYGIAKAQLARAGQPATPAATMRYALEIAQTNQIRNPDRIYAGQALQVQAPAAAGTPAAALTAARGAAPAGAASVYAMHDPQSQRAMSAMNATEEPVEHDYDADPSIDPAYAESIGTDTAAASGVPAEGALGHRSDSVETTRAQLALYQQSMPPAAASPPTDVPDLVYKGVVGKALDMVPLDPATRTGLQQANAVISGSLAGRSLAALTGFGGPLLTVAGLLWGIFSAQKIGAGQSSGPTQIAQNTSAGSVD